jgi:hypothetical protein
MVADFSPDKPPELSRLLAIRPASVYHVTR